MLLGGMTPGSLQPRLGREGLRHLVEAKARFFLPCRSCLSMWEQPPWSLPARARCHQPHSTWGGRGGAKGPPRGWVRLTPACTGRVCSSSHSKTGAAECLYSVGIIQPFAGMSSIYIYVQSATPSLLLAAQRGVGWLGCPGFASLVVSSSGHGLKLVPPNRSCSLADLLPQLFAVQVLEQAGSGLKSGRRHRCKAGGRRLGGKGRGVLGLESGSSRFRLSNGKVDLGSAVPFARALLAIPPLSSPGQGVRLVQPRQRGWRLAPSGLKSAPSQQGLKQPPEM